MRISIVTLWRRNAKMATRRRAIYTKRNARKWNPRINSVMLWKRSVKMETKKLVMFMRKNAKKFLKTSAKMSRSDFNVMLFR